jgi:hypothetical protein
MYFVQYIYKYSYIRSIQYHMHTYIILEKNFKKKYGRMYIYYRIKIYTIRIIFYNTLLDFNHLSIYPHKIKLTTRKYVVFYELTQRPLRMIFKSIIEI